MSRRGRPAHPDILTPREWEVLGLVERGYTNDEIASRLGVTAGGVKFHMTEILGKLHLSSRKEAARWHRERFATAPLWLVLRDWLWASPLRAAEVVGGSVVAVALAGVVVLAIGIARADTNEDPVEGSRMATTVVAPVPADASLEPLARLAPGRHAAPSFGPPLTYSIPDVMIAELFQHVGWLIERYEQGALGLSPDTAENHAWLAGAYPLTFLFVLPNIAVAAEDCSHTAAPGVGRTATEIVGALATRSGLITSGPVAVAIGGLSGQQIDLSVAPDWTRSCDGGTPSVPLLYAPNYIREGAKPGERFRIIVLEVAGPASGMADTVMIVVYAGEPAVWDRHLSASMAVVNSFVFDTAPARQSLQNAVSDLDE